MVGAVEAASASTQTSQGKWGPIAYSTEAVVVLLITAVLIQLRFSSLLPRIAVLVAKGCTILGISDCESTNKVVPVLEKKSEAAQAKVLGPEIKSLEWEAARRETRARFRSQINEILGICAVSSYNT